MRLEDVKIGMKVVPHAKSDGICDWNSWIADRWENYKLFVKQGYLTVQFIESRYGERISLDGDYFLASDFEPYIEIKEVAQKKKKKVTQVKEFILRFKDDEHLMNKWLMESCDDNVVIKDIKYSSAYNEEQIATCVVVYANCIHIHTHTYIYTDL